MPKHRRPRRGNRDLHHLIDVQQLPAPTTYTMPPWPEGARAAHLTRTITGTLDGAIETVSQPFWMVTAWREGDPHAE